MKKVVDVKPVGSQILVEMLSAKEASGSILELGDNADIGAPQAYVLALGPSLKADEFGIRVGDRVVVAGNFTPIPPFGNNDRKKGVLEPHNVKAVLVEN